MEFELIDPDEAYGTSFHDEFILATKKDLVSVLGEPNDERDGYKVNYCWVLAYDGRVFTIYDWKEGEIQDDQVIYWHIGHKGINKNIIDQIINEIYNQIKAI